MVYDAFVVGASSEVITPVSSLGRASLDTGAPHSKPCAACRPLAIMPRSRRPSELDLRLRVTLAAAFQPRAALIRRARSSTDRMQASEA